MPKSLRPGLVFQPATHDAWQQGIDQIARAIRPTLGPLPRLVAVQGQDSRKPPELLDNGAVIARRILELNGRAANTGAMFLRQMLWRLYEEVGDGTATATVIFTHLYHQGRRYIAAGGNAMDLRHGLETALSDVINTLNEMAVPLDSEVKLTQFAETLCQDAPLAAMLGEIFDIIGEYGQLEIRPARTGHLEREYVEGMYWDSKIFSRYMLSSEAATAEFHNAALLISDLSIENPAILIPPLELAKEEKYPALIIIARKISEKSLALLLANSNDDCRIIAVTTPGATVDEQMAHLQDLAILTGGRAFHEAEGICFDQISHQDFGVAHRAWANSSQFGIINGQGNARRLRQHFADLQQALAHTSHDEMRDQLQKRLGRFLGGVAILWVGAMSQPLIDARAELARRTAKAVRNGVATGVVAGGGTALLYCGQKLLELREGESASYRMVADALAMPFRVIVSNSGYDAAEILAQVPPVHPSTGFDCRRSRVVDMMQVGIVDALAVQKAAVSAAVRSAILALTVDVVVQHRNPEVCVEP